MEEYEAQIKEYLKPFLIKDVTNIICDYLHETFSIGYTYLGQKIRITFMVIKSTDEEIKDYKCSRKLLLKVVNESNISHYKLDSLHIVWICSNEFNQRIQFIPLFANNQKLATTTRENANRHFNSNDYLCSSVYGICSYSSDSSSSFYPSFQLATTKERVRFKQFLNSGITAYADVPNYVDFEPSMYDFLSSLAF
jgi:hypothetical protein